MGNSGKQGSDPVQLELHAEELMAHAASEFIQIELVEYRIGHRGAFRHALCRRLGLNVVQRLGQIVQSGLFAMGDLITRQSQPFVRNDTAWAAS